MKTKPIENNNQQQKYDKHQIHCNCISSKYLPHKLVLVSVKHDHTKDEVISTTVTSNVVGQVERVKVRTEPGADVGIISSATTPTEFKLMLYDSMKNHNVSRVQQLNHFDNVAFETIGANCVLAPPKLTKKRCTTCINKQHCCHTWRTCFNNKHQLISHFNNRIIVCIGCDLLFPTFCKQTIPIRIVAAAATASTGSALFIQQRPTLNGDNVENKTLTGYNNFQNNYINNYIFTFR